MNPNITFGAVHIIPKDKTMELLKASHAATGKMGFDKPTIVFDVFEQTKDENILDRYDEFEIVRKKGVEAVVITNTDTADLDEYRVKTDPFQGKLTRQTIQSLIAADELEKAMKLLEEMKNVEYTDDFDEDDAESIQDQMPSQMSRLNNNNKSFGQGIMSHEEYTRDNNRIKHGLEELIKNLPKGNKVDVNKKEVLENLIKQATTENRINPFETQ